MSQGDLAAAGGGFVPGFATLASGATPVAPGGNTRAAIARAAQATGVDFNYLLAQARIESSLNPTARAGTSSAAGLYQFTQGTWAQVLQQHGGEIGLDGGVPGGTLAALRDPAQRARLMALRFDPDTSARMAAELAADNRASLSASLGRAPSPAELYVAHFLGSDGANRFLAALATNPGQSAAALLPKAADANRGIFYDPSGAARSVGAVMALIEGKMANAMQDGGTGAPDPLMAAAMMPADPGAAYAPQAPAAPAWAGQVGAEFASAQANAGAATGGSGQRLSMAETLGAAFGLGDGNAAGGGNGGGATPEFVRSAYGRLRSLGL